MDDEGNGGDRMIIGDKEYTSLVQGLLLSYIYCLFGAPNLFGNTMGWGALSPIVRVPPFFPTFHTTTPLGEVKLHSASEPGSRRTFSFFFIKNLQLG